MVAPLWILLLSKRRLVALLWILLLSKRRLVGLLWILLLSKRSGREKVFFRQRLRRG